MAGIVAALEADDDVGLLGEPIDEPTTTTFAMRDASSNGRSRLGWFGFRLQPPVPIMDDALRSKENRLSQSAGQSRQ
jgi:hypothetical protein